MELLTINGGLSIDERGELAYSQLPEGFTLKRFYLVRNHRPGFIRAWHGHKAEAKLITCISGAVLLALVQPDRWDYPNPLLPTARLTLSATQPRSLLIPPGHAHGWMSLTTDSMLLVLSDKTADESRADDFRFPAHLWEAWKVEER